MSNTAKVIKSAGRALNVLALFERKRCPLLAREIAETLDMPRSSANVLLTSLVNLGYLKFDSSEQSYFPTQNVRGLGAWLDEASPEDQRIANMLDELSVQTGETVALGVQDRFDVKFARVLRSRFPIALQLAEGDRIPLFGSASGGALLSARSDEVIRSTISAFNQTQEDESDRIEPETLLAEVREVRRSGISIAYGAYSNESGGIAIPLSATQDGNPLAVGLGGPRDRMKRSQSQFKKLLRDLRAKYDL